MITTFDEIGANRTLNIDTEVPRIRYTQLNRRLWEGNFGDIGMPTVGAHDTVGTNWFRRVATFYAEFLYSENPVVRTGDERLDEYLNELADPLFREMEAANVDMLRFGRGIVASDPLDPLAFRRFKLDQWYPVGDLYGHVFGDAFVIRRHQTAKRPLVDLIQYEIEGPNEWRIHELHGDSVGTLVQRRDLPPRLGRQVVTFSATADDTSIFDGMRPHVGAVTRALTALTKHCLLYTSPSPRDRQKSRMPSSA